MKADWKSILLKCFVGLTALACLFMGYLMLGAESFLGVCFIAVALYLHKLIEYV